MHIRYSIKQHVVFEWYKILTPDTLTYKFYLKHFWYGSKCTIKIPIAINQLLLDWPNMNLMIQYIVLCGSMKWWNTLIIIPLRGQNQRTKRMQRGHAGTRTF